MADRPIAKLVMFGTLSEDDVAQVVAAEWLLGSADVISHQCGWPHRRSLCWACVHEGTRLGRGMLQTGSGTAFRGPRLLQVRRVLTPER